MAEACHGVDSWLGELEMAEKRRHWSVQRMAQLTWKRKDVDNRIANHIANGIAQGAVSDENAPNRSVWGEITV